MKPQTFLRTSSPLVLLLAAAVAFSQDRPQLRAEHDDRAEARPPAAAPLKLLPRARAVELVVSTAEDATKWSDRAAAARVLSEAADLIWGDDPDRARSWLNQAWEIAGGLSDKGGEGVVSRYRSSSSRRSARGLVLATAQRRDKALADHFLGQLAGEQEQTERGASRGIFDDKSARSEQLLNLALSVVGSDPGAAAGLAELSLSDGVSFRFQSVLLALRERDKSVADRLFDSAIMRLSSRPCDLSEAQVIASYLFTPGRIVGVGSDRSTALAVSARRPTTMTPAEVDPERARRFLNIVQQNILSSPAPSMTATPALHAQEVATLAGSLQERFRLYAPDLWAPIAQRVTAVLPDLAPRDLELPQPVTKRLEAGNSFASGVVELNALYVEGLKEAAEKEADPVARKFAYVRAAMATSPEDLPRGLSLAAGIGEEGLRKRVSSFLTYRAALAALEKGQLDKATELAPKLPPLEQALVCIAAARRLGAPAADEDEVEAASRKARAVELISDAEKALKGNGGSRDEMRVRLGLVAALAPLDAARALNVLGDVITDINRTDSFDPYDAGAPSVGGLYGLPAQASLPAVRGGFGLKDAFSPLSKVDFEESVYIAGRLKAAPARGICMLEIARSILAEDESTR